MGTSAGGGALAEGQPRMNRHWWVGCGGEARVKLAWLCGRSPLSHSAPVDFLNLSFHRSRIALKWLDIISKSN